MNIHFVGTIHFKGIFFIDIMSRSSSIASLGTDIASQMLSALTFEKEADNDTIVEKVSLGEQRKYLMKNIDMLPIADRKDIGNILVMNNKRELLIGCAEGTVINLDSLNPFIIEQMYNLMSYKINKRL